MALESSRCLFAETADMREGTILPLSETNLVRSLMSL